MAGQITITRVPGQIVDDEDVEVELAHVLVATTGGDPVAPSIVLVRLDQATVITDAADKPFRRPAVNDLIGAAGPANLPFSEEAVSPEPGTRRVLAHAAMAIVHRIRLCQRFPSYNDTQATPLIHHIVSSSLVQ